MPQPNLDTTFQALADPTRRAIVAKLRSVDNASLTEIAAPFDMSLPGVMKHVGILEGAGLLEKEKVGRTVYCRLNARPMAQAINWLQEMEAFWSERFDALALHVEQQTAAKSKSKRPKTKSRTRK